MHSIKTYLIFFLFQLALTPVSLLENNYIQVEKPFSNFMLTFWAKLKTHLFVIVIWYSYFFPECRSLDCEHCFSRDFCTKCKPGFKLHKGKCLIHCPEGTFAHQTDCLGKWKNCNIWRYLQITDVLPLLSKRDSQPG